MKEKLILKIKKQKPSFKNVELGDIEKIASIEASCHISPWTKKNFLDSMSSENTFQVLKNDELIIGYYVASFAADECELLNITIKRDSQGKGFGKIALDHLINYCLKRETLNLFLEVRSSNKNAILLYENKGFNEVGIRPNYYKTSNGKEDAILMALSL